MSIITAILILSASVHAERSMETDDSIAGIVAQCIGGLVSDVGLRGRISETGLCSVDGRGVSSGVRSAGRDLFSTLSITIDGQSRSGLRAIAAAACRIAGYVADFRDAGSVGYSYRLRVRGYAVRRETRLEDGRVVLTTDAWWVESVPVGRQTKRISIHVQITIRADETDLQSTRIVGTATGTADTRDFRCGLVRRIAERQATEQLRRGLPRALNRIEAGGRQFYASGGDIAGLLDGIKLGIEIWRLRR